MEKSDSIANNVPPAGPRASSNDKGQRLARPFCLRVGAQLFRLLALSMVLLLLTIRLGSFTEETFVTPVEDAIFDVAFISDVDHSLPTKVIKSQRALDCDLPSSKVSTPPRTLILALLPAYVPVFLPDEIPREIFVPPEGLPWSLSRA